MSTPDFDIAIAGAGMVGATLACLLGKAGLRVALFDAAPKHGAEPAPERVVAITPASENIFRHAGIWSMLAAGHISSYLEMQVWSSDGRGEIGFDSAEIGVQSLGHIIANDEIEQAARLAMAGLSNVVLHSASRIEAIESGKDRIILGSASGERVSARLLVGADGGQSTVRALAGIKSQRNFYRQRALICTVTTEQPHQRKARQRFLARGPLAFLPLSDPHQCSIVWTVPDRVASRLLTLDDDDFCAELSAQFEFRLGEVTRSTPRLVFDLARAHAERYIAERVALVGDAAHTVHPLAGQGVNLGLMDAAALAELIAGDPGRDLGARSVLRRYERWRKGDNAMVLALMDGFNTVFASESETVRRIGNLGLAIAHRSGVLKHHMMRLAMGTRGDVPAIARQAPVASPA